MWCWRKSVLKKNRCTIFSYKIDPQNQHGDLILDLFNQIYSLVHWGFVRNRIEVCTNTLKKIQLEIKYQWFTQGITFIFIRFYEREW